MCLRGKLQHSHASSGSGSAAFVAWSCRFVTCHGDTRLSARESSSMRMHRDVRVNVSFKHLGFGFWAKRYLGVGFRHHLLGIYAPGIRRRIDAAGQRDGRRSHGRTPHLTCQVCRPDLDPVARPKSSLDWRADSQSNSFEQGCGNGIHCDITKRASRLTSHTKRGFPCITEVGTNPLIPQPWFLREVGRCRG